jgi:hypothetical protein
MFRLVYCRAILAEGMPFRSGQIDLGGNAVADQDDKERDKDKEKDKGKPKPPPPGPPDPPKPPHHRPVG